MCIRWFMSLWGLHVYETHKLCFLAICIHAISGSLQHITFSSWVYYTVNIGRIYPLEPYNVHKGGLKHHQVCLFLKAIPLNLKKSGHIIVTKCTLAENGCNLIREHTLSDIHSLTQYINTHSACITGNIHFFSEKCNKISIVQCSHFYKAIQTRGL